jgi:HD-like signal output (HDOD) protein
VRIALSGHAEVGGYLLALWGLPWRIVEAVACHHAPESVESTDLDLVGAVHLADALVHELGEADPSRLVPAYLDRLGVSDRLDAWRAVAREELTGSASTTVTSQLAPRRSAAPGR